jgi:hypothetical protein
MSNNVHVATMKRSHAEMSAGDAPAAAGDAGPPAATRPRTGVLRDELRRTPVAPRYTQAIQQVVLELIFTGTQYDARKCE